MSLLDEFMQECAIMDKVRTPDGEGGYITTWQESVSIQCAIVEDSSTLAKIAEKQGVSSTYTLTTKRSVSLDFHDVIKRKSDGSYFRVTSRADEKRTPSSTALDMNQVSAERWEMTT